MYDSKKCVITVVLVVLSINVVFANVIVEVSGGPILGKEEKSYYGRTYLSFKGIPFVRPPTGNMRFKRSNSSISWDEMLPLIDTVPHCSQTGLGYNEGYEDCLYLSVYTSQVANKESSTELYPVLVWLHGGNFITGMSQLYQPHLIMDKNIVVVIPQYRLGILGFLTYHSPDIHGNYGLFDQLEALHWVHNNIELFGGDASQVTLAGDCAGSASAIYHMISPLSQGLFHRVIGLSGTPLNIWALQPQHTRFTKMFSEYFGCNIFNQKQYINCMQKVPIQQLMDGMALQLENIDILIGNNNMAPVVANSEAKYEKDENFLPEQPLKSLLEGNFAKVPVLLGVTEHVGDYLVDMGYYYYLLYQQKERPEYFDKFTQKTLGHNGIYLATHKDKEAMIKYYLPNWDRNDIEKSLLDLGTLLGDAQYTAGIFGTAELLSGHVPVNVLRFGYEGGPKYFDLRHYGSYITPPMKARISHGDEMFFLLPDAKYDLSQNQSRLVNIMLNILENFCYGREPLPNWPLFTPSGKETSYVRADGNIRLNDVFADEQRIKWLRFILKEQNRKKAEEMVNSPTVQKWIHEEL